MSRALVLGGGGPVGVAWQAGLLLGLAGEGIDLAEADLIVGTSAGSIVGSQVAAGTGLHDVVEVLAGALNHEEQASPEIIGKGMETLLAALSEAATAGGSADEVRVRMGQVATSARTMPEGDYLELFSYLEGSDWPAGFQATAVAVDNGEFILWDATSGVDLQTAVASSCAVPGVFPPVTIAGRRYMDGGIRTPLNADAAAGHEAVVAISCLPLSLPEGISDPGFELVAAETDKELTAVRESGSRLGVVAPGEEFLAVSEWGMKLMDARVAPAAFEAGKRQGVSEAPALRPVWEGPRG